MMPQRYSVAQPAASHEDRLPDARLVLRAKALRSEPAEEFERSELAVVGGNGLTVIRDELIGKPYRDRFADQSLILPRIAFPSD